MKMSLKFDRWIHYNPMSREHSALFRIIFMLFYFLSSGGLYRYDWIAKFPAFFYDPPASIGVFFDTFPDACFFHAMNIVLPLLAVCVLAGFKTAFTSFLLGLLLIVNQTFLNSFGTISHFHLIPFTLLIFAFSGWGQKFSIDEYLNKDHPPRKILNVIPFYALIIAFSYFSSGFSKITGGWLDIHYQSAKYYAHVNAEFFGRYNPFTLYLIEKMNVAFVWEILDYLVVIIEILPLLTLFNAKYFRLSLFFIATFHIGVYLSMNIVFGFYPLLYLIFIVNWRDSAFIKRLVNLAGKYRFSNFRKLYIVILLLGYLLSVTMLYMVDLKGEEGLAVLISLFVSYGIVLAFFLEPYCKK